jgi:hypothetical protein
MRTKGSRRANLIYGRPVRPALLAALTVALVGALVGAPAPVRAQVEAGAVLASLACDRADGPGRVRCEVEARVAPGQSISWGDVVLLKTPPFTLVLRGRIGPHDATVQEPEVWRWAFALAARDKGTGTVDARVRMVVCQGKTCTSVEAPVSGKLVVGG